MAHPTTSLTKFKDGLRVPPTLHPHLMVDQRYHLRVHMRPAQPQLHSELPPSEVWAYEGSLPDQSLRSRGDNVFRLNGSMRFPQISRIPSRLSPPRTGHKMSPDAVAGRPIRLWQGFSPGRWCICMAVGQLP